MDNENQNQEFIIIHSYAKAWKIESRIYAIFNWVLPFPITLYEALYFVLSFIVLLIICSIITPLATIPALLRYFILPMLIARVVSRQKLDGMNPIKFFAVLIGHLFTKGLHIERFKYYSFSNGTKIKLDWWCSRVKKSDRLCKR